MEQSSEEERERILEFIYSDSKTETEIEEFVRKVANSGAMLKVEEVLKEHSQKALDILGNLPKTSIQKRCLTWYNI